MAIRPIMKKIKSALSQEELRQLYLELNLDHTKIMGSIAAPESRSETLVNEIVLMISRKIQIYGDYNISDKSMMQDFEELDNFAEKLTTFSETEIKAVLVSLLKYKLGSLIASNLLSFLDGNIPNEQFDKLISDAQLRPLY